MANKEMNQRHTCPVCGKYEFEKRLSFDICEECGWQDDLLDEDDPDSISGANEMTLEEAREAYSKGEQVRAIF